MPDYGVNGSNSVQKAACRFRLVGHYWRVSRYLSGETSHNGLLASIADLQPKAALLRAEIFSSRHSHNPMATTESCFSENAADTGKNYRAATQHPIWYLAVQKLGSVQEGEFPFPDRLRHDCGRECCHHGRWQFSARSTSPIPFGRSDAHRLL
jgi:hypothetical protein